ncbi:MAG: mechanosensitive ion channel family protein [Actinomycetota bacterium]
MRRLLLPASSSKEQAMVIASEILAEVGQAFHFGAEEIVVLVRIAGTLLGAFILARFARSVTERFERRVLASDENPGKVARLKRARTLGKILLAAFRIVIWTVASLMVLSLLGVDVRPLLAAAGVGGIALGFGAQNLVRDILAGFFILFEHHYDVDDIVSIGGVNGKVESIGIRTTTLRDLDGRRHIVPNGEVRTSTNLTKDFSRYLFDLPISYEQDIDRAVAVAREAAENMRKEPEYGELILVPLEVLGVDNYADSNISVKVYVETVPGKQFRVGRELRRRIKQAWDGDGISVPYPHQQMIISREDLTSALSVGAAGGDGHRSGDGI